MALTDWLTDLRRRLGLLPKPRPRRRRGDYPSSIPAVVQVLEQRVMPTTVWVASTQNGTEGGQNAVITLQRDNTAGMLNVMLTADPTSTAQSGNDYQSPGSAFFMDGQAMAVVPISIIDDAMVESTETLDIRIMSMPGMYNIVGPGVGNIHIFDNDQPPNMPPTITANQTSFMVTHDQTLNVTTPCVSGWDPNNDPITLQVVNNVAYGQLTLNQNATFTYTPAYHYAGPDSFVVRYIDSHGATSSTVTVTLNVMNMPPSITSQQTSFTVTHDQTLNLTTPFVTAQDSDGDPLTLQLVTNVAHGQLTLN